MSVFVLVLFLSSTSSPLPTPSFQTQLVFVSCSCCSRCPPFLMSFISLSYPLSFIIREIPPRKTNKIALGDSDENKFVHTDFTCSLRICQEDEKACGEREEHRETEEYGVKEFTYKRWRWSVKRHAVRYILSLHKIESSIKNREFMDWNCVGTRSYTRIVLHPIFNFSLCCCCCCCCRTFFFRQKELRKQQH